MRTYWAGIALLVMAAPLAAQQGQEGRGRMQAPRPPGLERSVQAALERAELLGLDEARVEQLRQLQAQLQEVDRGFREQAREFRQQMRDADAEAREARRAAMEARREEARALRGQHQEALLPLQERFEGLLSVEERARLRELERTELRQRRPGAARRGRVAPQYERSRRGGAIAPRGRAWRSPAAARGTRAPLRLRAERMRGFRADALRVVRRRRR